MPEIEILKEKEQRDRADIDELRDKIDEHGRDIAAASATAGALLASLGLK